VGVPGLIGQIVRDAPVGARVVVAGICSQEDSFLPLLAVSKELTLHFVSFYRLEEYRAALAMLAEGRIDWQCWVTGEVGLNDVARAFAELRGSDRHAKILIRPALK
jgi:threonine dehydrogenase-like Zn-dependent dehydrogenase